MATVRASIRLADRGPADTLVERAIGAGLNVDRRRNDTPVARPYEVDIYGQDREGLSLPDLWEGLPDTQVVLLVEGDD